MSQSATRRSRPVVLCILDGWGHRDDRDDNAIALADTPTWDRLNATCPKALLQTSGLAVGLPDGQMGNSEVGHMNLGAGRVVMQDLPRIDQAVADGTLAANPLLVDGLAAIKARGGCLHLLGLLSPGGVHSHQGHMVGLARIAHQAGVPVRIHAFMDGRDTPPASGLDFMQAFLSDLSGLDARVVTVSGRYYAMDRDKRWDRVQLAFDAMMTGTAATAPDALSAIRRSYEAGKTDEFIMPVSLDGYQGMADGDGLLMANFRADRAREILHALADPAFDGFARARTIEFSARLGLSEYSKDLSALFATLFPSESLTNILGQVVAEAGLKQLRIAETEKYAHVTFFFNGGLEQVYPGEDRILVPSPKVATYDLQPAMSAPEVTEKLVAAIGSGQYDLIVANYANGDMVGHTGILTAAIQAAQTIDASLSAVCAAVTQAGGVMLITADHGNAEQMTDPQTRQPHTAHTTGPVDAVLVGGNGRGLVDGRLADVAPTLLSLMGLPQPAEMTGSSLLRP